MGGKTGAPINEAVYLLDRLAPGELSRLRSELPEISDELQLGIMAGAEKGVSDERAERVLLARARLVSVTLERAVQTCDSALVSAARKMVKSRRVRLCGQVVTVVASSGVLAAIGLLKTTVAVLSAILALLGSLAAIGAEYFEQVADAQRGSLNSIYLEIANARHRASILHQTIQIYLQEGLVDQALERAIGEANALSEEINGTTYQLLETVISRSERT